MLFAANSILPNGSFFAMQLAGLAAEELIVVSMLCHELTQFLGAGRDHHVLVLALAQQHARQLYRPFFHGSSEVVVIGPIELKAVVFSGNLHDPMRSPEVSTYLAIGRAILEFQIGCFSELQQRRLNRRAALAGFDAERVRVGPRIEGVRDHVQKQVLVQFDQLRVINGLLVSV